MEEEGKGKGKSKGNVDLAPSRETSKMLRHG